MLRSLVNTQIDVCTRPVYNLNIFVSVLLGAPIGVVVALFESRRAAGARTIAEIVMRILEVIQAFPVFVFAVVLVTVFGGSTANIIAAVAFTDAPQPPFVG